MSSNLPSLGSLLAFVAAAKNVSFTKAANELCLTQGAVSKQISLLEGQLEISLFERHHQSIKLTKAGKKYLAAIESAIESIRQATTRIKKERNTEEISLNILPSLGSKWILDHLETFKNSYPNYKINVATSNSYTEIDAKNGTDFYIRIAKKKLWKGFDCQQLMTEKMICVCSPKFMAKHKIKTVANLANCHLLQHTSRPHTWEEFFKKHKIKKCKINSNIGFQHFFMLIKAAKSAHGVGLVPDFLVKEELEKGELLNIFEHKFNSSYKYYLISAKQKAHLKKIENFRIIFCTQFTQPTK